MNLIGNDIVVTNEAGERLQANITSDRWPLVPGIGPDFQGAVQGKPGDKGWGFWNAAEGGMRLIVACEGYETQEIQTKAPNRVRVTLKRVGSVATPITGVMSVDGKAYRLNGQPWRYAGVSDFRMAASLAEGRDMSSVFSQRRAAKANAMRFFDYTPAKDWGSSAWNSPSTQATLDAIIETNRQGFAVQHTFLLDDDPARIPFAIKLIEFLTGRGLVLRLEAGNEPNTHKEINTHALIDAMKASGYLWTTGDYEDSRMWRGTMGTFHPARTFDYVRRAHDAMEYWNGGGPNNPAEPACQVPWDNDEPIRPDQCAFDRVGLRAHAGASAQFCGGATFHSQSGKLSMLWNADEESCAKEFFFGLHAFPAGIQNQAYRRIVEGGNEPGGPTAHARTYVVGNSMVRCQQVGSECPEPGWTKLDPDGTLFTR